MAQKRGQLLDFIRPRLRWQLLEGESKNELSLPVPVCLETG